MIPNKRLFLFPVVLLTACISLPEVEAPQGPPDGSPDSGTPPSLTLTLAAPGGTTYTNGTVSVQLQVQGDTPEQVELLVDDQPLTTLQSSYTFSWDTTSVAEGSHRLAARARIGDKTFASEVRDVVVDRTPPQVVSRTPTPGAQDVWVRQPIQATFSEPLKPSTLTSASVKLLVGGTEVVTTPSLSSDGKTLTVTPFTRPTVPNTLQLTLTNAATDLAGNALSNASNEWAWSVPLSFPLGNLSATPGDTDAADPCLQIDQHGTLFVSWREPTGTSTQNGIYTYTLANTNWQPVGGPLLTTQTYFLAGPPTLLLDSSGKPFVAWTQPDGDGPTGPKNHIHINRWNGSAWIEATTSPEYSVDNSTEPQNYAIQLDDTDNPVLVWNFYNSSTGQVSSTQAWHWTGSTWMDFGAPVSNNPPTTKVAQPLRLLLGQGDKPLVTWSEGDIFASRWTGSTWSRIGSALGDIPGDTPAGPSEMLLDGSGNPVLVWGETDGTTNLIRISRWTGNAWETLGSPLNTFPGTTSPRNPHLQSDKDGTLVVAWEEPSQQDGPIQIKFRRWTGAEWVSLGDPIITSPGNTPLLNMSFKIDPSGNLYVIWLEKISTGAKSIQVHRYNY